MTAATTVRARSDGGPDCRGNNRDRRRRREWLVEAWRADVDVIVGVSLDGDELVVEVPHGVGAPACRCYRCGDLLTLETLTVDRVELGKHGGRYTRDNIRPACSGCNSSTGGAAAHECDDEDDDEGRPW